MARIIEAATDFTQQLGVSWGGSIDGGKVYNTNGSERWEFETRGAQTSTGLSGENFAQDAASAVAGVATGGSINFLIGRIGSNLLDIRLSAMEKDGNGKILASPKVITQNNMAAMIKSGVKVPIQTVEEGTVTVKFEDALIRMDALPHIIGNGIFLDLKVIKDDVDESRQVKGNPFLLKKEITTKVLVSDGETVVIGGLINQKESEITEGIPYLSKIPLFGWFFRYEKHINEKTELLIFITPSILKDA
jgi:type IV pilus assembly protein PilQ